MSEVLLAMAAIVSLGTLFWSMERGPEERTGLPRRTASVQHPAPEIARLNNQAPHRGAPFPEATFSRPHPEATATGHLAGHSDHSTHLPVPRSAEAKAAPDTPPLPTLAGPVSPPPHHASPGLARSFNRGPASRRAMVLTFDGGSSIDGAMDILDTLKKRGIRTTFFLTGAFIRDHPALVLRLVADGHEIGNHTDTHPHLTLWASAHRQTTREEVDRRWMHNELRGAATAFHTLTGRTMAPLWRAPFGEYNKEILRWALEDGWTHVGWTGRLDSLDWVSDKHSRIYHSARQIASRLLAFPDADAKAGHGAIILMHLGSDRPVQERLSGVLPQILQGFEHRGFEFVTASDMMSPLDGPH